jgi:hypothetical protein
MPHRFAPSRWKKTVPVDEPFTYSRSTGTRTSALSLGR